MSREGEIVKKVRGACCSCMKLYVGKEVHNSELNQLLNALCVCQASFVGVAVVVGVVVVVAVVVIAGGVVVVDSVVVVVDATDVVVFMFLLLLTLLMIKETYISVHFNSYFFI